MKKSQPSSRATDAAERSPSVYFANLKADMLLQKQLAVIRRAENNLVHSITIDQKILFRRFQAKLRRSKLARAQLYADKATERELRSRDLHVLNTNCGQQQDDVEFLKKLQRRPCLADDNQEHRVTQTEVSMDNAALIEITDEEMEQYIQAVMEDRVPPVSEKTLRTLQTIGELMEQANVLPASSAPSLAWARPSGIKSAILTTGSKKQVTASVRPLTTAGGRNECCQQDSNKGDKTSASSIGGRKSSASRSVHRSLSKSPYNAKQWNDRNTKSTTHNLPKSHQRIRPMTSPASSSLLAGAPRPKSQGKERGEAELTSHPAPKEAPHPLKRVASPDKGVTTAAGTTLTLGVIGPGLEGHDASVSRRTSATPPVASMFEDEKKVDLVALRLAEARRNDLGPKVMAFLKSLLDLEMKERLRAARRARQAQIAAQIAALGENPDMEDPQVLYLFSLQGRSLEEVTEVEVADAGKAKEPELKGDRKWDYYATKMALQSASAKKDPSIVLPGTPEEVKMRMAGNQNVRSITMPTLNFDFEVEGAGASADRRGGQPVQWAYDARGLRRQTTADILVVRPELENRF